ncbi:MAG: hypothetical protein ACTHMM_13785 [Agriterribacter sp.]
MLRIDHLILSQNVKKDQGGGKSSFPSLKLRFTNSERTFLFSAEEYSCVNDDEILWDFKKGDTVSIKLKKSGKYKFSVVSWFNKSTKIYGLTKNNKEYLSLECRNKLSTKQCYAAAAASIVSAALSLFFAVLVLKPKTKLKRLGSFQLTQY